MYAIVKAGGKQYKVAPGDKINIEKIPAEVGDKVTLDAICIVDGKNVEADPAKAAATKVEAVVLEQFRDKKVIVFKFKKRKNYKRTQGHRQNLTRVQIIAVGSEKYEEPKAEKKASAKKTATKDEKAAKDDAKKSESKAAAKPAAKKAAAKKAGEDAAEKKAEPKKATAKKAATKKDDADAAKGDAAEKATEE